MHMSCYHCLWCCSLFKTQKPTHVAYQKLIDDREQSEELIGKILDALGGYNKPEAKYIHLKDPNLDITFKRDGEVHIVMFSYENTRYSGKAIVSYEQAVRTLFATEPEIPLSIVGR